MSNVFTRAAAVLARDTNLSRPIGYTPAVARGLPAVPLRAPDDNPLRAIFAAPTEDHPGLGGRGSMARAVTAGLPLSTLPYPPLKGDSLTDGTTTWRVERVEIDIEETQATLTLVPA